MKWFKEAVTDNATGLLSSTRITALVAGLVLSFSTLVLTIAVLFDIGLVPALSVALGATSALAGANYVAQRAWPSSMHRRQIDDPDDYH